ncbi:hypothetical protein PHYC_03634 [Phycisphaerales bacterium]|nr:hypothetical protein PHYC_03634 [Phycisphaerales bacterium]
MAHYPSDLRSLWFGLVICLATLFLGFAEGVVFGAADQSVRTWLIEKAQSAVASSPDSTVPDPQARVDRAWTFFRRSHLHANGMATTGIVLIALLPLVSARRGIKQAIAGALGLGSAGYAAFLITAGLRTPGVGDTHLVKESLRWLAMPSAGMYVAATLGIIVLVCRWAWGSRSSDGGGLPDSVVEAKPGSHHPAELASVS